MNNIQQPQHAGNVVFIDQLAGEMRKETFKSFAINHVRKIRAERL